MPLADIEPTEHNRVAFRTIGCKLNQCETAQMQEALAAHGYRLVDWDAPADVRVINTCTVTSRSDKTCRNEIRHAKRLDPDCLVVVTGCYAQVDAQAIAAIPGVDLVLGNLDKQDLVAHLRRRRDSRTRNATQRDLGIASVAPPTAAVGATVGDGTNDQDGAAVHCGAPLVVVSPYLEHPRFQSESFSHFHGYTRAFLKIQTGCDSRCAYCVIPLARGPACSMPKDEVLAQVQLLAERQYREVVLTGINLGSWGRDTGEGSLADLLTVLVAKGGTGRYRLSSIEPLETDDVLQQVVLEAGDKVAHHFHLPLQSGSDPVLERMNRPYTTAQYLEIVTALATRFPDAAIGADVIAGFPGETDEEFRDTLSLIEHAPLTYLHVFSYSDRPRTAASLLRPKVSPETIHARTMLLRALGERKRTAFHARLICGEQYVLLLNQRASDGRLVGLSGNYVEILLDGDDSLMNKFAWARVDRFLEDGRAEGTLLRIEAS